MLVRQGIFNELVSPVASGSASGRYVTFSAYLAETATIDGTGLPTPGGPKGLIT